MRIGIYSQIFAHYLHCGAFVTTAWPSLVHDQGAQSDNDMIGVIMISTFDMSLDGQRQRGIIVAKLGT